MCSTPSAGVVGDDGFQAADTARPAVVDGQGARAGGGDAQQARAAQPLDLHHQARQSSLPARGTGSCRPGLPDRSRATRLARRQGPGRRRARSRSAAGSDGDPTLRLHGEPAVFDLHRAAATRRRSDARTTGALLLQREPDDDERPQAPAPRAAPHGRSSRPFLETIFVDDRALEESVDGIVLVARFQSATSCAPSLSRVGTPASTLLTRARTKLCARLDTMPRTSAPDRESVPASSPSTRAFRSRRRQVAADDGPPEGGWVLPLLDRALEVVELPPRARIASSETRRTRSRNAAAFRRGSR